MRFFAEIFGDTHRGCVRDNNEDSFIATFVWDDRHILCAAIDGIGGYEGGEVAAEIARSTITHYVETCESTKCLDIIKQAVVEANNEIVRQKEFRPELAMMGCVVSAALIDLDRRCVNVAHVGDSRIYSFHGGELLKLSHDHSLVGYREEIGDLTEEEAMHHPQRNIIDRSLGDTMHMFDDHNFIDAAIFPIADGSTQYLFCSDGLSDMLTSAQIAETLYADSTPKSAVETLIAKANAAGGKDNVTVVIAKVDMAADDVNAIEPDHMDAVRTPVVPKQLELFTESCDAMPAEIDDSAVGNRCVHNDDRIPDDDRATASDADKAVSEKTLERTSGFSKTFRRRCLWLLMIVLALGILLGVGGTYIVNNYLKPQAGGMSGMSVTADTVYALPVENQLDSTEINRKNVEYMKRQRDSLSNVLSRMTDHRDSIEGIIGELDSKISQIERK